MKYELSSLQKKRMILKITSFVVLRVQSYTGDKLVHSYTNA